MSYTPAMEFGAGLWLLGAVIVGIVASREFGRSGVAWFILSLLLTPLVGLLLFALPPRRVPCPFCAEPIKPSAVVCRFCGRSVTPSRHSPQVTNAVRLLLLAGILAGIIVALTRCEYEMDWWRTSNPVQVLDQVASLEEASEAACGER
jgi:hypothetical protein